MTKLYIKKLENLEGLDLPFYATPGSSGMDLCAAIPEGDEVVIYPGKWQLIPTGISTSIEDGYEIQIRPRSGLAFKNGISVLNTPGTIDSDYRGEIKVILMNFSDTPFYITRGMRIAQMIVNRVEKVQISVVEDLDNTERAEGGFGSTGILVDQ